MSSVDGTPALCEKPASGGRKRALIGQEAAPPGPATAEADNAAAEQAPSQPPTQDQPSTEAASADQASADQASGESQTAEKASEQAAPAAGSAEDVAAPTDPVKSLVSAAIKNAVDNAPSEGKTQTIAITSAQAQALGFFNRLMFDGPDQVSPAILAKMNPESFEEELREMMEARIGDQINNIPFTDLAGALLPVCEQMQVLRPQVLAAEADAQAAAGGSDAAPAKAASGAAPSGGAVRPRLPARAPRAASGAAAAAGAVAGRPGPSEWATIYGPDEAGDVRKFRETLQQVRVDTCRAYIKSGIGMTSVNLRQTLMRLRTAEQQAAAFSRRPNVEELARETAQQLEASDAPFGQRLVVAVIGIRGAGKTALIRKLLGMDALDPFDGGTRRVQVVDGVARGMPARFIDTPGLDIGFDAQQSNRSTMLQLRNVLRKKGNKPHVYLFVDRMDESRSQEVDAGLLASAYQVLGRGQIYHTIGVLTHAACKPPDTKSGALEYEAWSTPRTRALQFTMMLTSGDRTAQYFTALAENHPMCRVVEGEPVLPNGTRWAPHLLDMMLMFLGLRMGMDVPRPKKKKVKGAPAQQRGMDIRRLLGGAGEKAVPVTYILQQYNQPKAVHKLPDEERAILSPGEIRALKEEQHEQAREEQRRRREYMKLREEEARNPEPIVPTLAPDPPLPPVFEAQQHTYRYRYNENQAGWIARPFVDSNGPDRSDGINGGQAERSGTLRLPSQYIGGAPARVLFQSVKDKESMVMVCNAESSASIGRDNVVTTSLESQTLSGDAIYTLRVEPRFKYLEVNGRKRLKTAIGLLNTRIAEEYDPRKGPVAKGIRLEQRVRVSDGLKIVGSHVGMVGATPSSKERGRAWGLEATYKPKGSIEGRELMAGWNTMGTERLTSGGQARGGHRIHGGTLAMVQHLTPETMLNSRVQMSSNGQSTLSVRVTSHDKMSMRWAYLMPVLGWLIDKVSKRTNEPADF